jgi:hypothetical protein
MAQNRVEPHKEAVSMISKRAGAGMDTSEKGPARLHAPAGKARPVEAGPARLMRPVGLSRPAAPAAKSGRGQVALAGEMREAGPPRMVQRFTR